MGLVLGKNQSAFVLSHLIIDNILISHELLHTRCFRNKNSKLDSMAMKLDMAKAYDRVERSFLRSMMIKLGFHVGWVNKIMMCIQLISYAFW